MNEIYKFQQPGKASFILGGQFGSESKGAAAAWVAIQLARDGCPFNVYTCNNGAQSGHTSIHEGHKRVAYHLPTAAIIPTSYQGVVYLNAGAIINPSMLTVELAENPQLKGYFFIHPNAAVITAECLEAENKADSPQTRIASTRKGVGEALSRKVLRSGLPAYQHPYFADYARRIDLNESLAQGSSVLVEVPQGLGLSLNSPFYPHVTSRDCTIQQAMNDAQIHPHFMGSTMLVLRTFPIRVGNIMVNNPPNILQPDGGQLQAGYSGDVYPGQNELTWEQIGVKPEITTVTKRVRRVFDWSHAQTVDALRATRPEFVFLTHVDYLENWHLKLDYFVGSIDRAARQVGIPTPRIIASTGPTTADVFEIDT